MRCDGLSYCRQTTHPALECVMGKVVSATEIARMRKLRYGGATEESIATTVKRTQATVHRYVVGIFSNIRHAGREGLRSNQVPCPQCGSPKNRYAKLCRECRNATLAQKPAKPDPHDACPRCGLTKLRTSALCQRCSTASQRSGEHYNTVNATLAPQREKAQMAPTRRVAQTSAVVASEVQACPPHHWKLNHHDYGVCCKCGAERQFEPPLIVDFQKPTHEYREVLAGLLL